jgi:hypothetical protein
MPKLTHASKYSHHVNRLRILLLLMAVFIQPARSWQNNGAFKESISRTAIAESQISPPKNNSVDCSAPGVYCDTFGKNSPKPLLPCIDKNKLLHNERGQIEYLRDDYLQEQALEKVLPEWPLGTPPGYQANIYIVVGTKGEVLCADIMGPDDAAMQVALAAALKWRFKPILEKGVPIPAIGLLSFETPKMRKYKNAN